MQIVLLVFIFFLLFLIDLPILFNIKKNTISITYSFLMLIGFCIGVIVMKDLPITSPAIVIEKLIKSIMMR